MCATNAASEYYEIELVSTRKVLGSARAQGVAAVYDLDSPFPVSVAADGRHIRRLEIGIDRLAMLLTDSASIREVILFPQLRTIQQS